MFVAPTGTLAFLGFSEDGFRVEIRDNFEDVHCDFLGPKVPIDVQHFQADALITGTVIRWNESLFAVCEDRSLNYAGTYIAGTAGLGRLSGSESGALMLAQGKTYRILFDAPFVGLPAFPGMRPYNFPNAWIYDTIGRERGTRAERVHITVRAIANFTNIGTTGVIPNVATLYDSNNAGVTPLYN